MCVKHLANLIGCNQLSQGRRVAAQCQSMVVGCERWFVVLKKFITISKKGWQVDQYVDGQLAIVNWPWTKLAAFGCHSSMWPNTTTFGFIPQQTVAAKGNK